MVVGISAAVVAGAIWLIARPRAEEQSARGDARAVAAAVAGYVVANGALPRVTVTTEKATNGDTLWGGDFLVESQQVPRTDPSQARFYFVVGDADRWCVQMQYTPKSLMSDAPPEWVSVEGSRGATDGVSGHHCGDGYVLTLSPATITDVPAPGSVIAGATASIGTCTAIPSQRDGLQASRSIKAAACDAQHFGEIYAAGESASGDFVGYEQDAETFCATAIEPFVGVPRTITAFTGEQLTADQEAWTAGVRTFSCLLFLGGNDYPLVGSARDSLR